MLIFIATPFTTTYVKIGTLCQLVADIRPITILSPDFILRPINAHGVLEIAEITLIPCK